MRALVASALVAALVAQAGCAGGLSENHRRGLVLLAGASVIIGGVMVADGASCENIGTHDAGCEGDDATLYQGLGLVIGGVAVGALAYLLPHASSTPP